MEAVVFIMGLVLLASVSSQEIQTQTATEGNSTTIVCSLEQKYIPFWIIDDIIYEPSSIPLHFLSDRFPPIPIVDDYNQLTIPIVTLDLNNTIFQCASFDNDVLVEGTSIKLNVIRCPAGSFCLIRDRMLPSNSLLLNNQDFDIDDEQTFQVGWYFNTSDVCSTSFIFEGFPSLSFVNGSSRVPQVFNIAQQTLATAKISRCQKAWNGDPIVYRIVAVDQTRTICSATSTQRQYFRFDVPKRIEQEYGESNRNVCFNFPKRHVCRSYYAFEWPPNSNCLCPVPLTGNRSLRTCGCLSGNVIPFVKNRRFCLNDTYANLNGTIVQFQCRDPISTVSVKTIVSIHRIIDAAGKPTPMANIIIAIMLVVAAVLTID